MKSYILFKSRNQNSYLYSVTKKEIFLVHPVLGKIISLFEKRYDFQTISESHGKVIIDNKDKKIFETFDAKEFKYNLNKFLNLQERGYFDPIDHGNRAEGEISPKNIQNSLANLKQVTFEVTDSCNLRCKYCGYGEFYNDYDQRENQNLSFEKACSLLVFLATHWNSSKNRSLEKKIYISFYGGEPLLNFKLIKDIVHFVKSNKALYNQFVFSMTTNGILLEKYMDFLAENNFSLLISLDGDEPCNTYRVFHDGQTAYQKIIKNVNTLKEKYPKYFEEKVNFNAVLHNKNSVAKLYHYFKKNFEKTPSISELNFSGIAPAQQEKFWKTYTNIHESLHEAEDYSHIEKEMFLNLPSIKSIGVFIHKFSGCVYRNYSSLLYSKRDKKRIPTGTCMPFSKKIYMTVNGKILPCERISHDFALGQVKDDGVHLNPKSISQIYNQFYQKLRRLCTNCYNLDTCQQCMFYLDLDSAPPDCNGFLNEHEFKGYLEAHVSFLEENPGTYEKIMKQAVID